MNKKYFAYGYAVGILLPILLFVLIAYLKFNNEIPPIQANSKKDVPKINFSTLEVVDLNGNKVDITNQPDSIMIVDFWATWCVPCVESFPKLDSVGRARHTPVFVLSDQKIDNIHHFKDNHTYKFIYLKLQKEFIDNGIYVLPTTLELRKKSDSLQVQFLKIEQ